MKGLYEEFEYVIIILIQMSLNIVGRCTLWYKNYDSYPYYHLLKKNDQKGCSAEQNVKTRLYWDDSKAKIFQESNTENGG